jgi:hypothetical protein
MLARALLLYRGFEHKYCIEVLNVKVGVKKAIILALPRADIKVLKDALAR